MTEHPVTALDMATLLADIEVSIADLQSEYGDRAPIMRDMNGRYIMVELIQAWASVHELLKPELRQGSTHAYTSTACQHGLHTRCRRTCKYCEAECRCNCHVGPTEDAANE